MPPKKKVRSVTAITQAELLRNQEEGNVLKSLRMKPSILATSAIQNQLPLNTPSGGESNVLKRQKTKPSILATSAIQNQLPLSNPSGGESNVLKRQKTNPSILATSAIQNQLPLSTPLGGESNVLKRQKPRPSILATSAIQNQLPLSTPSGDESNLLKSQRMKFPSLATSANQNQLPLSTPSGDESNLLKSQRMKFPSVATSANQNQTTLRAYLKAHQTKNGDYPDEYTRAMCEKVIATCVERDVANSSDPCILSPILDVVCKGHHGGYERGRGLGWSRAVPWSKLETVASNERVEHLTLELQNAKAEIEAMHMREKEIEARQMEQVEAMKAREREMQESKKEMQARLERMEALLSMHFSNGSGGDSTSREETSHSQLPR